MKRFAYVIAVCLTALLVACSGNPKPKVLIAYEGIDAALSRLQDAERAAFKDGTIPKDIHEQRISPAFSKAFAAQIAFGQSMKTWNPSASPLPDGYDNWLNAVDAVADVVAVVSPKNADIARTATAWAKTIVDIIVTFKRQPSAQVTALAAGGVK